MSSYCARANWKAYHQQRRTAAVRGIGWEITFEDWVSWWGDDIERRGTGPFDLQMQRVADAGPYRLDNIKKGTPRHNAITRAAVLANKKLEAGKRRRAEITRQLMDAESGEDFWHDLSEDEQELLRMFRIRRSYAWAD